MLIKNIVLQYSCENSLLNAGHRCFTHDVDKNIVRYKQCAIV